MSYFEIRAWAWNQDPGSAPAKFVLVALAQYADNGGYCFPSYRRLSEMTGLSVSGVRDQIRVLHEASLIQIHKRSRQDGGQTSNLYRLLAGDHLDDPDEGVVVLPENTPPVARKQPPLSGGDSQELRRKNLEEEPAAASGDANAVEAAGADVDAAFDETQDEQEEDAVDQEGLVPISDIDPKAEKRMAERDRQREYNKRAQALAGEYTRLVPLSKFPAILTMVKRAMGLGYDEDRIRLALIQLGEAQRSVTVDSLRIALDALPKPPPAPKPCPCCTGSTQGSRLDLCKPCSEADFQRLPCNHGKSA